MRLTRKTPKRKRRRGSYSSYLFTPHWRKLRERKLAQVGHACEDCGATIALYIHHRTYQRIGKERLADLTVLCELHHEAVHAFARNHPHLTLATATDNFLRRVRTRPVRVVKARDCTK